jgi:small subunit ribosomal protein S14
MSKKSIILRDIKRRKICEHYASIREELKKKKDWEGLRKLPRNASPVRLHNRCSISGRGRGYLRDFGVSRIEFRSLASQGLLPGVIKASW